MQAVLVFYTRKRPEGRLCLLRPFLLYVGLGPRGSRFGGGAASPSSGFHPPTAKSFQEPHATTQDPKPKAHAHGHKGKGRARRANGPCEKNERCARPLPSFLVEVAILCGFLFPQGQRPGGRTWYLAALELSHPCPKPNPPVPENTMNRRSSSKTTSARKGRTRNVSAGGVCVDGLGPRRTPLACARWR